jgi:hypothetical protein
MHFTYHYKPKDRLIFNFVTKRAETTKDTKPRSPLGTNKIAILHHAIHFYCTFNKNPSQPKNFAGSEAAAAAGVYPAPSFVLVRDFSLAPLCGTRSFFENFLRR